MVPRSPRFTIRPRGRHRRTSRSGAASLLRGGVLTGFAGTVAVTGAADPAAAAEAPAESTGELPALHGTLAASAATAALATRDYASDTVLASAREEAEERAIAEAAQAAAERAQAEQARRQAAEEARQAQAAREQAQEQAREQAQEQAQASATQPEPTSAPASGGAAAVVAFVTAQLGDAYASGGTGPDVWDCSGLVQAAYASIGVSLPRVAADQSAQGTEVSLEALQPGDILYWGGRGAAYHVAIYVGGGSYIGAQNPASGVVRHDLSWDRPTGAVRVL